ncbi:MAG: class I SAM-dependent methyltransferase [Acidimicrobiales bacterium]|jgi:SAM-dependent methyltransferase
MARSVVRAERAGYGDVGQDEGVERARYGWQEWAWDASLFEGSASYYRRGRIPYAEGLADSLATALDLAGQGRLLDVGCGPGIVALRLASLFEEVVGVDPDPGMLEEARQASRLEGLTNASWVQLRAEDLPAGLGTFRVITFAQSFHWMDRAKVASAVRSMIEPDGAVVQIDPGRDGAASHPSTGPHPSVPFDEIDRLRRHYLGPDRRAGQSYRNTSPSGEDAVFQAAGFLPEVLVPVTDRRVLDRSTDDLVAWVFSASSTAPHLFGDELDRFEADLRALLDDASPSGHFSVPLSDTILRIRRPSQDAALDGLSAHR